ncbi:CG2129 [Drosophila busckii]|uniref:CG2129 n=1 Tax=Drosophila busckii TaxID=30019 RepID=A0A0M4ET47_DROBS|nr:zinc finger protein 664 [Drosophila busckii]ALC48664.1 CG2129 [Drosophila busckii]
MLKTLKPDTYAGIPNAKCGEVYFQSPTSYRIDCAFCDIKSFIFMDFLLHIKNEHFENGLLKTEMLLPKQEQLDTQPTSSFSWYELATNDDDDENDSDSEQPQPQEDEPEVSKVEQDDAAHTEDPVAINSIMKWQRETRATKVDYNEESEAESEHEQSVNKLACKQCKKTYQSKKTLERHMERQHNNEHAYSEPEDETPKPSLEYRCEHCDKVYQGKYTLRQHLRRDHTSSNPAEVCICLECNAQLPRLRQLDEHMLRVHGGAACVVCSRRYKTRHELKRHQLKHTSERNVPCTHPGCEKRFFTLRHMRNHSKVHSEQKNFVCESCGYSCRNKETLRVHLRSHTGERPFGCKVCDKRFPSHSGLREHMAMHSTERPHVCNVCGATFSRQKGLYHHKFLHTATKQFVCKLCGNAYAQAAGLAGHMRKHRNDQLSGI